MTQGRILFLIVRLACSYLLKYAVFDSYQPISCNWYHEMGELFHDRGRYHIETSPLICRANHGFIALKKCEKYVTTILTLQAPTHKIFKDKKFVGNSQRIV